MFLAEAPTVKKGITGPNKKVTLQDPRTPEMILLDKMMI
jgi:hypothetical protein